MSYIYKVFEHLNLKQLWGSSSDESEETEWNDYDGNDGTSAVGKKTSASASKYPSRISRTAAGANAARSLDGVG